MDIQVVTIFPEMFAEFMKVGVIGKACKRGVFRIDLVNPRDFASDRHGTVDDRPYGGGAGMVLKSDVMDRAIRCCKEKKPGARVVFLTPQGRRLDQSLVREMALIPEFILVSGRYQGIDQRVIDKHADDEISIGDYVLSGGELPAMVFIEAVTRMLEGVVGKSESVETDTFSQGQGLLAPPVYTRPELWEGKRVPAVLLNGNHEHIRRWRYNQSVSATQRKKSETCAPKGS